MDHIFEPRGYFTVPDGTEVSPFLNATDTNQTDVPWGILGEMSLAAGKIGPGISSYIHLHPAVTQITYLTSGNLRIWMKDAESTKRYKKDLETGQAVISEPGTLFQLHNESDLVAEVLYIVSPSYVFEMNGDEILYDDSIMVAQSWEELESVGYDHPALKVTTAEQSSHRSEALRRLAARKS